MKSQTLNLLVLVALGTLCSANAQSEIRLGTERAIAVTAPTEDGGVYQLSSSANLASWQDVGVPFVGDGKVQRIYVPQESSQGQQFFRLLQLPGKATNRLSGLQDLFFSAATFEPEAGGLRVSNLRAVAKDVTPNDYIDGLLRFDPAKQTLSFDGVDVAKNVGVANGTLMVVHSTNAVSLGNSQGLALPESESKTYSLVTDGSPLSADLDVGHFLGF